MGKFLVRITLIITSLYLVLCFFIAQFVGKDILDDWYNILFEAIVVVYCFSEGKYHCRYMKYLSISILFSDVLTRLDNSFNFLSVTAHNLIPISILAIGITTSITLALRYFYRVNKVKKLRQKNGR